MTPWPLSLVAINFILTVLPFGYGMLHYILNAQLLLQTQLSTWQISNFGNQAVTHLLTPKVLCIQPCR